MAHVSTHVGRLIGLRARETQIRPMSIMCQHACLIIVTQLVTEHACARPAVGAGHEHTNELVTVCSAPALSEAAASAVYARACLRELVYQLVYT